MLQYVAGILSFGFLGLSFLMLYLGYRSMQTVISSADPDESAVDLCRFFLKISLVFMIFAGPLQWATLYVQSMVDDKAVKLYIGMPVKWNKDFGEIGIFRKGEFFPIGAKVLEQEFRNNDEINIDPSSVAEFISAIRAQLQAVDERRVHGTPEVSSAIEGG